MSTLTVIQKLKLQNALTRHFNAYEIKISHNGVYLQALGTEVIFLRFPENDQSPWSFELAPRRGSTSYTPIFQVFNLDYDLPSMLYCLQNPLTSDEVEVYILETLKPFCIKVDLDINKGYGASLSCLYSLTHTHSLELNDGRFITVQVLEGRVVVSWLRQRIPYSRSLASLVEAKSLIKDLNLIH